MQGKMRGYDFRLVVVATVSTLVLILKHYYHIPIRFPAITYLVFYLLIPLAINCLLFNERPSDYGICLGNWKLGLLSIGLCLSIMAVGIYVMMRVFASS